MKHGYDYLTEGAETAVSAIVANIDRDVARGEDILMLGLGLVMMSSFFAPVAPPKILLPLVALTFALSAGFALHNCHSMQRKLFNTMRRLDSRAIAVLRPIAEVLNSTPPSALSASFNPLKNLKRLWKSALGGILINPLWMPIFYMMGMQIDGEKLMIRLNKEVCTIKLKVARLPKGADCEAEE
jgi:hypothetical protein